METAAHVIFEAFQVGDWGRVEEAISRKELESLFLDFKRKANCADAEFAKDDKRNLAEALSGFANSEGGVIVWGVGTARIDNHDGAIAVHALRDLSGSLRELLRLTPEMASPPVRGVRHLAIENPSDANAGVIVTLVPQSDLTPHMARGPGQQRYYRRTESGFRAMEHYEVADLFGRRAHPVLELDIRWRAQFPRAGGGGAFARLNVQLVVMNSGRGLANYPCLTLGKPEGYKPDEYTGNKGGKLALPLVPAPEGWWLRYSGAGDVVVYPDDQLRVAILSFDIPHRRTDWPDLEFEYRVVAADTAALAGRYVLSGVDIRNAVAEALQPHGYGV